MTKLNVLMVQPTLRWQEPAENRQRLESQVEAALAGASADLVVLPETFTTGFLGDGDCPAEPMDGDTVAWMKQMARRHDAAIAGSVVISEGGNRFNRFLFVPPEGDVAHYDKRHLFSYGGENNRYTPGQDRVVFEFRGWRICPQVCYDLRFPVWCRNRGDYDLLLFVANWPEVRAAAWSALLPARAIENQACVIGINRVGQDGKGISYLGQSAAYGPLGESLAHLGGEVTSAIVELDLEALNELRARLPFLDDADQFDIR